MPLPDAVLTTTCDVYRPFGASTPIATGVPCRLTAVVGAGQPMAPSGLAWTHTLDVQPDVDLNVMRPNQSLSALTARLLLGLDPLLPLLLL